MSRKCPICNSVKKNIIEHISMELPESIKLPREYDIVACDDCGFTYSDGSSEVTQEDYNSYYESQNDYSDEVVRTNIHREVNQNRTNLLKKYVSTEENILDIGCGNGDFLKELKRCGYTRIKGVDPSENSVRVLQRAGIDAEVGNIFGESVEKYDVVCCEAVLEHIYDLQGCIYNLKKRLKGIGSKIFVDVPGMEGINEYLAPIADNFNCEHINYFTFCSLDNLFLSNGFRRISTEKECCYFVKELGVPQMAIGGLYELVQRDEVKIAKDTQSKNYITDYFQKISKKMQLRTQRVNNIIETEEKVIIWGCGNFAYQLLATIPEIREKILYFVDSNLSKKGRKISGKLIKMPTDIKENDVLIIICSMNYSKDIAEECRKRNLRYYIY